MTPSTASAGPATPPLTAVPVADPYPRFRWCWPAGAAVRSYAAHMPPLVPAPTALRILPSSADPRPVELAVAADVADASPPETYLQMSFFRPDGCIRLWHGWTSGGDRLGDRIDQLAVTAGRDMADYMHIADRCVTTSTRGRIEIQAYALRAALADVQGEERGPQRWRDGLAERCFSGRTPGWFGFGPALVKGPR